MGQAGRWTQTPFATPLQPKIWNAHFWITFNFWWLAGLVNGLRSHPPPFSSQKNEMLVFRLCSLLMMGQAGRWTQTPFATPLQPKIWNAHFWITFNFWWLAGLVNGLRSHPPPFSSQKNEMLVFRLCSLLMMGQAGRWTQTPFATPLQPKIWNAHFWIMFNFWWLAGLVDGLRSHPPPLSSQKIEMLVFRLCSLLMMGQAGQWTRTPFTTPLQPKKTRS